MAISTAKTDARRILSSLIDFANFAAPRGQRPYQVEAVEAVEAVVRSVLRGEGKTFAVRMARKWGRTSCLHQLEAHPLNLFAFEARADREDRAELQAAGLNSMNGLNRCFRLGRTSEARHGFREAARGAIHRRVRGDIVRGLADVVDIGSP